MYLVVGNGVLTAVLAFLGAYFGGITGLAVAVGLGVSTKNIGGWLLVKRLTGLWTHATLSPGALKNASRYLTKRLSGDLQRFLSTRSPRPLRMQRVFLIGCPRSGTTLLQSLLAAHPRVTSFPETHLFPSLKAKNRLVRLLGLTPRRRDPRWDPIVHEARAIAGHVPSYRISASCYAREFIAALDSIALRRGADVWVEKTPRHLQHVNAISKLLPNAKFIHIIRDGADVAASMYKVTHEQPREWQGKRSIDECIDRWICDVDTSRRYVGVPHHHFVLYELLVNEPERCLSDTCAFLGIEYSESMLNEQHKVASSLIRPEEVWKENAEIAGIRRAGADNFSRVFTDDERAYILERLSGYDEAALRKSFRASIPP